MGIFDQLLARAGVGGVPPTAGMLNLNPEDDQDLVIDPTTGAAVRSGMRRAGKFDPVKGPLGQLSASAGIMAPNAPFSAGAGADIPFSPKPPVPMDADLPPPGQVPMPQPRPAAADGPPPGAPLSLAPPEQGDSTIPARAQLAQGEQPSAGPGLLDRITNTLGNNSQTLIALGAGLAGAPNAGQGISRALTAALPAQQADLKRQLLLGGQQATYKALVDAGVPRQQAMAALQNPKLLEALTSRYMIDPKLEMKTIKDEWGAEHLVGVDPYTGLPKTRDGVPVGDGAPGTPGTASTAIPTSSMYAPGVSSIDQTKIGDDYLNQFSPEMQGYVKAYINGGVMPTGRQQLMQHVKMIAQKYGNDMGIPVDDNLYNERKTYMAELGKNAPNTAGGQGKAFSQALEHFAKASDAAVALGNWNLGLVEPSHWVNAIRGQFTSQRDAQNKMQSEIQTGSGETGKLFSGNSGGGVHERQATRDRFVPNGSGPEHAGAFEGTLETMEGGLNALQARRDRLFPHGAPQGSEFLGPAEQANIDKIRRNIEVLRGNQPAAVPRETSPAAAPAATAPTERRTSTGVPWTIVPTPGAP